MLALHFHWTPEQINAMDPDILTEIEARLLAGHDHAEQERKRREREQKANEAKRRLAERMGTP